MNINHEYWHLRENDPAAEESAGPPGSPAVGTMRMPYRPRHDAPFASDAVLDEDLRVSGTQQLYVCDVSVLPFSSAANPARTLVALALRLSRHLG